MARFVFTIDLPLSGSDVTSVELRSRLGHRRIAGMYQAGTTQIGVGRSGGLNPVSRVHEAPRHGVSDESRLRVQVQLGHDPIAV